MAAFWKLPTAVRLGLGLGLAVHHLLSGFAEQFRHGQMELCRQPIDLLVNRVEQLHFGSFHSGSFMRRLVSSKDPFRRVEITSADKSFRMPRELGTTRSK